MAENNTTDLRNGVVGEVGCKYPATVASLSNITLEGLQTINGVSVTDEMIIVVAGQADKTENGIYIPSTGEWQRAVWFDDELDAANGTLVFTSLGTQYSNTLWRTVCADDPIVFGTSEIDFEIVVSGDNTGDVTLAGQDYLTLINQVLTANKISLSNMANLAANSFIANNTGSAATPLAITPAQATAMLNVMVGDGGSGGVKGLVPAPAIGDANKVLKGSGVWDDSGGVPIGSSIIWNTDTPPENYLESDGSAISRSTYAALFAVIGTTFGSGDGSTTFNIPDFRGYFPRGWSHGGSIDSGRTFGSTQQDAFQGHYHSLGGGLASSQSGIDSDCMRTDSGSSSTAWQARSIITNGTNGTPRTASETRPVNLAIMFCIKYQ